MMHNVYARWAIPSEHVEADGGTWLHTDVDHDVSTNLEPNELEVELIFDSEDNPGCVEVEINFTSSLDARSITDRVESIMNKYDPVDTIVGVD